MDPVPRPGLLPLILALPPSAVITGCGRSGSGYIASVLKSCGLNAGHEAFFGIGHDRESGLDVDASWLAAPHLEGFEGQIWHQRRHPLDVLSSMYWIPDRPPYVAYRRFNSNIWPHDDRRSPTRYAALWLTAEGLAATHAHLSWNLEDVTPELIVQLSRRIGKAVPLEAATRAIDTTPKTVNQHQTYQPRLGWTDLDFTDPTIKLLRDQAARFDYE